MAGKRVLLVEDDEALARVIAGALLGKGYAVATAATCAQGLAEVCAQRPDVLVLDIFLPDGDGWQVLAATQERRPPPAVQVVVISGNRVSRAELRERGVFRFLAKPFDMAELLEAVEAASHRGAALNGREAEEG